MTLVKINPVQEFMNFHSQFRKVFESFPQSFGKTQPISPRMELHEGTDHFTVRAELPGMKKEELSMVFEKDMLTLEGEKKQEEEVKDGKYYFSERMFGSFKRSIRIPSQVKSDEISASFENGILTVMLPKMGKQNAAQKIVSIR